MGCISFPLHHTVGPAPPHPLHHTMGPPPPIFVPHCCSCTHSISTTLWVMDHLPLSKTLNGLELINKLPSSLEQNLPMSFNEYINTYLIINRLQPHQVYACEPMKVIYWVSMQLEYLTIK